MKYILLFTMSPHFVLSNVAVSKNIYEIMISIQPLELACADFYR